MLEWRESAFLREVERRSGAPVSACFQCHKCSNGCPIGPDMDYRSSQIMRLLHFCATEKALGSQAIWLCASCEACTTRCPMGIDVAAVMDTLRIMAVERKAQTDGARAKAFNKTFLGSVRLHGRVFELGMMAIYKLRSFDFFSDVDKVPQMMKKRKLAFLPHFSRSARAVRKMFKRAEEEEGKR